MYATKQPTGGALAPMNKQKWCFAECHTGGNTDLILNLSDIMVLPASFTCWWQHSRGKCVHSFYISYFRFPHTAWAGSLRSGGADIQHLSASACLWGSVQSGGDKVGTAHRHGDRHRGAMAADGGCAESVDQYRAELERLTQELAEANREKIRAAECGLVVLEENQALKQKYVDLETEQETLRKELEQLQEVRGDVVLLLTRQTQCSQV